MNTLKWIPKQSSNVLKMFEDTQYLERKLLFLAKYLTIDINFIIVYPTSSEEFHDLLSHVKKCLELSKELQTNLMSLSSTTLSTERNAFKILQSKKANVSRQNLKRRHFQQIYIIQNMIKTVLSSCVLSDHLLDVGLILCSLHNGIVNLMMKQNNQPLLTGSLACSNSFPALMLPPRKFDIAMIMQVIFKQRSELCCVTLISCLLATCKPESNSNIDSDSSSLEILKALTTQLASPLETQISDFSPIIGNVQQEPQIENINPIQTIEPTKQINENNKPLINELNEYNINNTAAGNDLLEHLIYNEENYIANILIKCLHINPSSYCNKPCEKEVIKMLNYGTKILWTQIGSTLEHVVLWWSNAPLACRQVSCAKYLRDWLLGIQLEDAPDPIFSILKGLGETLTVYVTGTTWDKQFRLTLVSSNLPVSYSYDIKALELQNSQANGTTAGHYWSDLFYSLTTLSNSCDRHGTIPDELPIVEQIPILHRIDHSVHTIRLWAAAQAKWLSTDWNMKLFFKVVNDDVNNCLDQLKDLLIPELVPTDTFEVLVHVCVTLRAKLISEIKVNIQKLRQTYSECIEVLSTTCRTISLATLSLCFPSSILWQINDGQDQPNEYVSYFLNQLYLPIIQATKIFEILSLVLKLMCEAWLDHIYMKRIKFSRTGAMNLLKDFDGVPQWINVCSDLSPEYRNLLSKHDVLRMCEGVAKILLRKPDEVISMVTAGRLEMVKKDSPDNDEKAALPPEMFVPNQQRWLQLRARNRKLLNCLSVCTDL